MSAAVVKLPTAARRQVRQQCNRHMRAAADELREQHSHRFPFMFPRERAVAHLADFIEANPMTPERHILMALIKALDLSHDQKLEIAMAVVGNATAKNIVELAFADTGKTMNVQSVLRRRGLL